MPATVSLARSITPVTLAGEARIWVFTRSSSVTELVSDSEKRSGESNALRARCTDVSTRQPWRRFQTSRSCWGMVTSTFRRARPSHRLKTMTMEMATTSSIPMVENVSVRPPKPSCHSWTKGLVPASGVELRRSP